MDERDHCAGMEVPDRPASLRALRRARRLHRATLARWAQDLLRLRAEGRLGHTWQGGRFEDGWWRRAA